MNEEQNAWNAQMVMLARDVVAAAGLSHKPLKDALIELRSKQLGTNQQVRAALQLTGSRREAVANILETVAKDGLPGPRDLDVALDAIESAYQTIGAE